MKNITSKEQKLMYIRIETAWLLVRKGSVYKKLHPTYLEFPCRICPPSCPSRSGSQSCLWSIGRDGSACEPPAQGCDSETWWCCSLWEKRLTTTTKHINKWDKCSRRAADLSVIDILVTVPFSVLMPKRGSLQNMPTSIIPSFMSDTEKKKKTGLLNG